MAVTRYHIQIGNEDIVFEGPDGLSMKQIEALADKHLRDAKPGQKLPHSVFAGTIANAPPDDDQSSVLGSFMRNVPKDATFNWGDEFTAAGNAAIPGMGALENATGLSGGNQQGPGVGDFWSRFKNNMADYRAQQAADDVLHPTASSTGRVAGVLGTLPRAGAAAFARLPEAAQAVMKTYPKLTAMGLGGVAGAVGGAGAGEGNRGQSAAIGGITGTVLGGALAGAAELLPIIANYGRVFFNKGVNSEAIRQLTKALHRDGFDVTSPSGVQKLKTALQEFTGKPVSLADVGGATRSRAGVGMRAPSDVQQQTIDLVHARQAGQGQRIATDIRANVAPRTDVHAINDDLVAQRAEEAERLRELALYEQEPPSALPANDVGTSVPAFPAPIGLTARNPTAEEKLMLGPAGRDTAVGTPKGNGRVIAFMQDSTKTPSRLRARVHLEDGSRETFDVGDLTEAKAVAAAGGRKSRIVNDPELQNLMRLPDAQKALTAALERSESERALLATQGKDISHLPDLNRGSDLDVRTVDTLKRFLDDEVNTLYRKGDTSTFKAGQAAQVKELRNAIRDRLKAAVPEYKDYLDAYKGSSEMIDSLEAGPKFQSLPPEQIAAEQADRSTAGQELYRTGVARNLLDVIKSTKSTANPASRILNSPEAQEQLLATGVSPANAARLNKSVQQERILNLLPREMAGSESTQRMAAQADSASGGRIDVPPMAAQPISWAAMAGRRVLNRAMLERMAKVNEELLPRITATDPKAIQAIIDELEQHGNIAAARTLRRQMQERLGAVSGSALIGGPVALPNIGDE